MRDGVSASCVALPHGAWPRLIDFLVERLNFDTDYMQVLCEDTKRCQHLTQAAAAAEAAAAGIAQATKKRSVRPKPTPTEIAA